MQENHKTGWITKKNIFVALLGAVLTYMLVTSVVDTRMQAVEQNIRDRLSDQEVLLAAIAETTARNGADAVTERVVQDCSLTERSSFDTLLGRLDKGLSYSELTELERLFGRCGSFYPERKAMMVSRLSRETEIYESYVEQLSTVTGEDHAEEFRVAEWKALATNEQERSELLASLVNLQDQIIATLLNGASATSPEMTPILYEVREAQDTLIVVTKQISDLRTSLVAL